MAVFHNHRCVGRHREVISSVDPTKVFQGSQSVQLTRINSDQRWAPVFNVTPAAPNPTVEISWEMSVPLTGATTTFGPFFGVEADSTAVTGHRLGGAGIDASTGELLFETPNSFETTNGLGTGYIPGPGFHKYTLDFNFSNQAYAVSVDGIVRASNLLFLNSATTFEDASLAELQAAPSGQDTAAGTAYFDNYTISLVPEPGSIGLLGVVCAAFCLRRRRKAAAGC